MMGRCPIEILGDGKLEAPSPPRTGLEGFQRGVLRGGEKLNDWGPPVAIIGFAFFVRELLV